MGTSNYAIPNASTLFALEDGDDWEDTRDSVSYALKELESNCREYSYCETDDADVEGKNDRSYSSTSIGELSLCVEFDEFDEEIIVTVTPKTTSAYYQGFSLDYDIEFSGTGFSYSASENVIHDIIEYPEDFMGDKFDELYRGVDKYDTEELEARKKAFMDKLDTKAMQKKLDEGLAKLTDAVEKIYTEVSTPLITIGRASNGETFYERA